MVTSSPHLKVSVARVHQELNKNFQQLRDGSRQGEGGSNWIYKVSESILLKKRKLKLYRPKVITNSIRLKFVKKNTIN